MSLAEMERRAAGGAPSSNDSNDNKATKDKDKGPGWGLFAILVLLAGGGVAVYMFVIEPKIDNYRLTNQHGTAAGSVIANGTVITIDHVDIRKDRKDSNDTPITEHVYKTRLTALEIVTGKQLAQTLVDGTGTCRGATTDTLWCNFKGLELYDMRTLVQLADVEDAVSKAKIGTPIKTKSGTESVLVGMVDGGKATLLVDDGRVAVFDATTKTVVKVDTVPKELESGGMMMQRPATIDLRTATSCATSVGAMPSFGGGVGVGGGRSKVTAGKLTSKETYLGPQVIGTLDPPLFVHHSSLDDKHDSIQLSRLDKAGGTAWTSDLGGGCEQVAFEAGHVIITTTNATKRAVAINAETGTVGWSVSF